MLQHFRRFSALVVVLFGVFLAVAHNIQAQRGKQVLPSFSEFFSHPSEEEMSYTLSPSSQGLFSLPFSSPQLAFSGATYDGLRQGQATQEGQHKNVLGATTFAATRSLWYGGGGIVPTAYALERDPQEGSGVQIYVVQPGDTLSSIARDHGITINTILWANNLDDADSITPGDELFILPVAGVQHVVRSGETLEDIAKKYRADKAQIIAFNNLPANGAVHVGETLVIPGGEKEEGWIDLRKKKEQERLLARRSYISSQRVETTGKRVKKNHGKYNRFPYGYCTWYVAQKRFIPWRGNAGAWLYNARAMGYATGKKPRVGAIVVTTDNPYYGHVALVEEVRKSSIVVSEMNYKGFGIVNKRVIPLTSRKIRGYIY